MVSSLPLAPILAAEPSQGVTSDTVISDVESRAIAFRATFGLASETGLVQRSLVDADYTSEDYGVPLSQIEVEELFRRARVQSALGNAIAVVERAPTFAGAFIDQLSGGTPVFLFTRDPEIHVGDIARELPPETEFRVDSASFTMPELLAVQDQVDLNWERLEASGIRVTYTGIDTAANSVLVGVVGLTDQLRAKLLNEFGPALTLSDQNAAEADACISYSDCRPMKGGITIGTSTAPSACTSGFVVKRSSNGQLHLLTAGHCIHFNSGAGVSW